MAKADKKPQKIIDLVPEQMRTDAMVEAIGDKKTDT